MKNLRVEPRRSATYAARPSLSAAYAQRGWKKLHLMVFNLTLDRDIPAEVASRALPRAAGTYSELNGVSAVAVDRDEAIVGWKAENPPLPLVSPHSVSHTFPPTPPPA